MNRPIKFRAWDGNNGYMMYSGENRGLEYLEFYKDGRVVIGEGDGDQRHENIPLMQFTGLTDKNGKEVYEGDWIACTNGSMGVIEYHEKDMAFKIATGKYDNEGGWLHPIEGFDGATLEVIGNLYEGKTR